MNETKPIEWAILIATITQPFLIYWLDLKKERRLKRSENLLKELNNKLKSSEEKLKEISKEKESLFEAMKEIKKIAERGK